MGGNNPDSADDNVSKKDDASEDVQRAVPVRGQQRVVLVHIQQNCSQQHHRQSKTDLSELVHYSLPLEWNAICFFSVAARYLAALLLSAVSMSKGRLLFS